MSLLGLLMTQCKPKVGKDVGLPAAAPASFSSTQYLPVTDGDYGNSYIFQNTTNGGFLSSWDFGGIKKSLKAMDTVFFAYKGTYTVTLLTASEGGTSSISKDIVVEQTSPYAADFAIDSLTYGDGHHFIVSVLTQYTTKQMFVYSTGDTSYAAKDTVYFPFVGKGSISLTVTAQKQNSSTLVSSAITKQVTITKDDMSNPALTDSIFLILTNGLSDVDGRTWVMNPKPLVSGTGVYSKKRIDLSYYKYPAEDPPGTPAGYANDPAWVLGALQNEFTFVMRDYQYIPKNTGVTCHYNFSGPYFGQPRAQYSDNHVTDPNHHPAPFILQNEKVGITGYTLRFGDKSYMAYFDNRHVYEIAKIKKDSVWIRHKYNDDPAADPTKDINARTILFTPKPGQ
jgi:hypothetical protein